MPKGQAYSMQESQVLGIRSPPSIADIPGSVLHLSHPLPTPPFKSLTPVHARYTGTGHADTTKYEWATHHHRDTLASIVGHPPMLSYVAIADGESRGRAKFEMIEVS